MWLREKFDTVLVFLEELGIIIIASISIIFILIILFTLGFVFKNNKKVSAMIKEQKEKLMWSSVLRSIMQGYFMSTYS